MYLKNPMVETLAGDLTSGDFLLFLHNRQTGNEQTSQVFMRTRYTDKAQS